MLEITGDDIAALSDQDLRALVALLCEAELRRRGLPTSAVTWGGDQNAADAGIDVRVALTSGTSIEGFVPRPATGYQVKASDMPRGEILTEMRPADVVRAAIAELASESGAYVIVSSQGSVSHSALGNRRTAMAEALDGEPNAESLALDFYDRTRMATWLRDHPGYIPWARERVGRAISGWHSYGAWAFEPEGVKGEYLIDDAIRIRTARPCDDAGLPAVEGIEKIRDILREPGHVVRIVGLSGVGKTRLVQALFDERVGERSIDPSLAIYTNMVDGPDPQPVGMATNLTAGGTSAILVVDNCGPELHRQLSELAREGSSLSVVTIEYDIREDLPEGTDVFELEPSSIDLIENLVRKRKPEISQVDARTIAEFSGGNARIALAVAATLQSRESISGFSDEELFRRLFQQRQEHDESLLFAAQACSLVYSFDGEALEQDEAELTRLAALARQSGEELHHHVAELYRRDLVQKRSVWRAVLPHAIANRLAKTALQNIPFATIESQLINGAPARLLKSFSRRLGYLHDSDEAIAIVEHWLAPEGLLGDVASLNKLGKAVFENVAPVAPEAALAALERSLTGESREEEIENFTDYLRLIRSLAYEATMFDRAAALLMKLTEAEGTDGRLSDASSVLVSLFYLYLSGTHATVEQRLQVIDGLLRSNDPNKQRLGLDALRAILEAWHFSSGYSFEFGARSRDFGFRPQNEDDVKHWFGSALQLAKELACSDQPIAPDVRTVIANAFRGMWTRVGLYEELEEVSHAILRKHFWREGWIAASETKRFDSAAMPTNVSLRLNDLEKSLRPDDLVEKIEGIVFSSRSGHLELDDFEEDEDDGTSAHERTEAKARRLGEDLIHDEKAFEKLLPQIVSQNGRLFSLGQGLAKGTEDAKATWERLLAQFKAAETGEQNVQVFRGFLQGVHDQDTTEAEALLEVAVEDETLAPWYPALQTAVPIDRQGVQRLKRSLEFGKAAISTYYILAGGRATKPIDAKDLKELLLLIAEREDGLDVALEILSMQLHSHRTNKKEHEPELIEAGRVLLSRLEFQEKDDRQDYKLGVIAKTSLAGSEAATIANDICLRFKNAVTKEETHSWYHDDLLKGLLKTQPAATLDGLFSGDDGLRNRGVEIIREMRSFQGNPLDVVPDQSMLDWCDGDPEVRYPTAAKSITAFHRPETDGKVQWTQLARALLEKSPDKTAVLGGLVQQFRPMSWSGSRAAIMENNAALLDEFVSYPDPQVVEFVKEERERLTREIEEERRFENRIERDRDERFE